MRADLLKDLPDLDSVAPRSLLTAGISAAAILLFIGTAGAVMVGISDWWRHGGTPVEPLLVTALLLNIALILLGWRRHHALRHEITVRTAAEARAHLLASRDSLTGFLNRRSIADEGAAMYAHAERRGKAMALMLIDLDHFKTVNDMHGHAVGDALLRAAAQKIANALPDNAVIARLGGDEFACGMTFDPAHPETVEWVAQALVSHLAQPLDAEGVRCHVSASIGIARSDFECPSMDALLRSADIAMYAAKKAGKNRYAWFDASMERELKARNDLELGLRTAIPKGQIVPFFEQQVDLDTGKLTGFEVLARWEHPLRGLIQPDSFIGIAEDSGMIGDLSLSIMRQSFAAARDWDPSLSLSINISPTQLRDPWLAQKIIKALVETGFPANRLEIEITESALFENLALAQSIIGSLKNQGIAVALDDFGTGYSSLAHLRALPFDRIKVDKSFITSINDSADSAAIVTAIVRLGESLNLPVTAEGVEDAEVQERLRSIGCMKGQGWYYGKPVSIAGARRLLAERGLIRVGAPDAPRPQGESVTSQRQVG